MKNRFIDKYVALKNKQPICVGLDGDISKLGSDYSKDIIGLKKFLFDVVDVTSKYAKSYKPNMAFYENLGYKGIELLKKLIDYVPREIPVVLDFKRGDIGNTSAKYAQSAFEFFDVDAITIAPYMGEDSVMPFADYKDRFIFVLGLTSNPGSNNFERLKLEDGRFVFEAVLDKLIEWNKKYGNIGAVIGATHGAELLEIREKYKELFFLIPGVGAQGGDLGAAMNTIDNKNGSYGIINSSRGILYPKQNENEKCVDAIARVIIELNNKMEEI